MTRRARWPVTQTVVCVTPAAAITGSGSVGSSGSWTVGRLRLGIALDGPLGITASGAVSSSGATVSRSSFATAAAPVDGAADLTSRDQSDRMMSSCVGSLVFGRPFGLPLRFGGKRYAAR